MNKVIVAVEMDEDVFGELCCYPESRVRFLVDDDTEEIGPIKKVYLIEESWGSFSDYGSKIHSAYMNKEVAYAVCHMMNNSLKKAKAENQRKANEDDNYDYDWFLEEQWDYKVVEVNLYGE